ncbi:MAG: pyrroline-5-carboxylate reductase [Devosiaceae bacterium]|nr:pyrroline-5-carboxylate reductase [Devosiaceae bacterium MH13]
MGSALVEGWLARGAAAESLALIDPQLDLSDQGWRARGVAVSHGPDLVGTHRPDVLLLAVKPQIMGDVLPGLAAFDGPNLTVVSIAAGVRHGTLRKAFPQACCVRTMPNTPAAVGKGVTACFSPNIATSTRAQIDGLLEAVGDVVWVDDEAAMDAVTALSGSGPAYVFHMVEALTAAGVTAGLPEETASVLARRTVVGAGALFDASEESAATLRENVTSPGGTTAAGLEVLRDSGALEALVTRAVAAARQRSVALAGPTDD